MVDSIHRRENRRHVELRVSEGGWNRLESNQRLVGEESEGERKGKGKGRRKDEAKHRRLCPREVEGQIIPREPIS